MNRTVPTLCGESIWHKQIDCPKCLIQKRLYTKIWRRKNPEKVKLNKKRDYEKHKEKRYETVKRWRKNNPYKYKAMSLRNSKKWAAENPEKLKEVKRKTRKKNRHKTILYEKEYHLKNKARILKWAMDGYYKRKYGEYATCRRQLLKIQRLLRSIENGTN